MGFATISLMPGDIQGLTALALERSFKRNPLVEKEVARCGTNRVCKESGGRWLRFRFCSRTILDGFSQPGSQCVSVILCFEWLALWINKMTFGL
jgi:hypothetical protein